MARTAACLLTLLILGPLATCADGGDACCPHCAGRDVCVPKVEEVEVEKHCWCVECKKVCVPAVRFPWERGGCGLTCFRWLTGPPCCDACGGRHNHCPTPSCGKVIAVRDLKKQTYECTDRQCAWEIRRLPPCCCNGAGCACCDVCAAP